MDTRPLTVELLEEIMAQFEAMPPNIVIHVNPYINKGTMILMVHPNDIRHLKRKKEVKQPHGILSGFKV